MNDETPTPDAEPKSDSTPDSGPDASAQDDQMERHRAATEAVYAALEAHGATIGVRVPPRQMMQNGGYVQPPAEWAVVLQR